ncbi:sensor histidine kinase N-terminal domain-containing protein [Xanthomonas citri]|uniref:sensor histidine kinase N-terminal domain-containing protein n=1 Tax=Xanthomonas citri TaxID=346 RepID=UPI002AB189B0|nr:sensor histidine kinase N-terminal domain-containing protein [Xanthomonas citri]
MAEPLTVAPSIRRTLLLYLGSLSLLGAVVLFFAARDYGQRAANRSYDHLLVSSALSIIDSVALVGGDWQVDLPYASLDLLGMAPEDRVFYRVFDAQGRTITGEDTLPLPPRAPRDERPLLFDAQYSGEPVRFAVVMHRVASASGQGEVRVQVGQTRRARDAVARDVVLNALVAIGVLSLLALGLVWLGVYRALRPLQRIEGDLSRREPSDLKPLNVPAPQEMQLMVTALNRFMARLSSSNETLRAFMAEAAHQMRTPLAALRAQAQLAMDDDPREMQRSLVAIERNASHMSRLLNQLLSDASVIHRANLQRFATVDLAEVLHQALHEALPRSPGAPRVQLAIDPQPALLRGDALLLREALKNLIDNACKYGAGASLQVALTSDGNHHVLTIADHGPGIPAAEAERVFERFVRGADAPVGGAGLGLAIVKRVVEAHGGRIDLANRIGGGLIASMHFPGGGA